MKRLQSKLTMVSVKGVFWSRFMRSTLRAQELTDNNADKNNAKKNKGRPFNSLAHSQNDSFKILRFEEKMKRTWDRITGT